LCLDQPGNGQVVRRVCRDALGSQRHVQHQAYQSLGHFCAALSSIVWLHSMKVACGFLSFVPTCNQPASKEGDKCCTDHIMYIMTVTSIHCMTGTQKLHRCCQGCSRQHPQQTARPSNCSRVCQPHERSLIRIKPGSKETAPQPSDMRWQQSNMDHHYRVTKGFMRPGGHHIHRYKQPYTEQHFGVPVGITPGTRNRQHAPDKDGCSNSAVTPRSPEVDFTLRAPAMIHESSTWTQPHAWPKRHIALSTTATPQAALLSSTRSDH
jgi:hypothetical protein